MANELLSVVVPIYNTERFLPKCVESILNQKYSNLEIILVDDGSTDSCGEIVDEYAKRDKRIQVIHKENGGLLNARYTGVVCAKGKYITFVDSDDWISEDMYYFLMDKMVYYSVDLVTSGCYRYFTEQKIMKTFDSYIAPGFYNAQQISNSILPIMMYDDRKDTWSLDPSTCFKIYKRETLLPIIEKLKDEKFYYGEDSAITYSYILEIKNMYCTNDAFYYHRQRLTSKIGPYFKTECFFADLTNFYYFLYNVFKVHELSTILIQQLDFLFLKSTGLRMRIYGVEVRNNYFLFPFDKVEPHSKIVVYGAGMVGHDYIQQIKNSSYADLVLWVDKNYKNMGEGISNPDKISTVYSDYVVIATSKIEIADEITKWLLNKGIEEKAIVSSFVKCTANL